MPEGLLATVTPEDLRDLFAYLQGEGPKSRGSAGRLRTKDRLTRSRSAPGRRIAYWRRSHMKTDMCVCSTTAGYKNLRQDFDVFLVDDATIATFLASPSPCFATNAVVSFASLDCFITQVSWVKERLK